MDYLIHIDAMQPNEKECRLLKQKKVNDGD